MRLRWFGHVKRRDDSSILRRAMELEVEDRMPVGRPKKTWSKVVEEDMKLNITEDMVEDRNSGSNSYHVQPHYWETKEVKWRWWWYYRTIISLIIEVLHNYLALEHSLKFWHCYKIFWRNLCQYLFWFIICKLLANFIAVLF